jgi:hypothetical protein
MTYPKIDFEKFNSSIQSLMSTTLSIQVRLLELVEFERQWEGLFKNLIPEFGKDVQIHIADQLLLNNYRYDKFHVIYDDLLSLIENEIQSEFSVAHNAPYYLRVKPIEDFIVLEKNMDYVGVATNEKALFEKIFASEKRKSYVHTYEKLFGTSGDLKNSKAYLKQRLSKVGKDIKGLRNLFSHRHLTIVQNRYSESWQHLEINNTTSIFKSFFAIVKDMYLLLTRTEHKGIKATNFIASISDQIDLILFGSIQNCIELFGKAFPNKDYSEARRLFYNSRYFSQKVVSSASEISSTKKS